MQNGTQEQSGVHCTITIIFFPQSSNPAISLVSLSTQWASRITKGSLGDMIIAAKQLAGSGDYNLSGITYPEEIGC